jgi:hypothetical protein
MTDTSKRYIIKPNASFTIHGSVPELHVPEVEFRELKALADAEKWGEFDKAIASYCDGTWAEQDGANGAEVEGYDAPEFVVEGTNQ